MKISGLNKTTLLDYPGRVACTIFLAGCNYRCPFCQNGGLVLDPGGQPAYSQEEILKFLKKRQGILEGVCITGGEPTLSASLPGFLQAIRELGYEVKLDTNGSKPDVVKELFKEGLISKVAMDIKAAPENYGKLTGIAAPDIDAVKETAAFLMEKSADGLEYEFRTTVVRELHTERDFEIIAEWLAGAKEYYLQAYRDSEMVIQPGYTSCTPEEMETYRKILSRTIETVGVRGLE